MTLDEAILANTQTFLLDNFHVRAYALIEKTFPPGRGIPPNLVSRIQIQEIVAQEANRFFEQYSQLMLQVEKDPGWLVDTFMSNWN